MSPTLAKILAVALLFAGESLAIYAEATAAKAIGTTASFWIIFFKMFTIIIIAGAFLIAGYMLGYWGFRDIWVVSVVSIASIVVMEPIINLGIFQEAPSRGAIAGLILGVLGLVSALSF